MTGTEVFKFLVEREKEKSSRKLASSLMRLAPRAKFSKNLQLEART